MSFRRLAQESFRALQRSPKLLDEFKASHLGQRFYSSLPEDLADIAKRSKFPARRGIAQQPAHQQPSPATAAGAEASPAAAPAAATATTVEQQGQQAGANIVTTFMFPWEKRQLQGGALRPWEKLYWGVFVVAVSLFLFNRLDPWEKEGPKVDEEKEAKKADMARLVLAGASVIEEEDDLFDGLSPEEIQQYVEKTTGAKKEDPFEGMSPEEINEYVKKHGLQ